MIATVGTAGALGAAVDCAWESVAGLIGGGEVAAFDDFSGCLVYDVCAVIEVCIDSAANFAPFAFLKFLVEGQGGDVVEGGMLLV